MARVLVVEDDALIRQLIEDELSDSGHAVQSVADGAAALDAVANEKPDAIVLDLMLPVVHGWDFIERYRALTAGQEIPIVVVSAAGAVPRSMERLGVKRFFAKPFDVHEVATIVGELAVSQESGYFG